MPSLHAVRWIENLKESGHELYWFDITGKGKMYKESTERPQPDKSTFKSNQRPADEELLCSANEDFTGDFPEYELTENSVNDKIQEIPREKKNLKRILLIYSDNTFQEIRPAKVGF